MGTPLDDPSFEYNGVAPTLGRNFRWCRKAVFQDQLRRSGWTAVKRTTGQQVYESITERQCMLALQATNDGSALCSQSTGNLEPYLGPQCCPQCRDDARYRANEPKAVSSAEEPAADDAASVSPAMVFSITRVWRLLDHRKGQTRAKGCE